MSKKLCFWWGFFGAFLPEIIRLKEIANDPVLRIKFFSIQSLLIFLAFFCFAGVFSIALKPENPYNAIWIGVSFPLIISTIAVQVPSLPL